MQPVNMLEAKSSLSRLVEAVEQGQVPEVVIARNGRPVARLVPLADAPVGRRTGVARGRFVVPDDIDVHNAEVARPADGRCGAMNLLLDTHVALWALADSPRLSDRARVADRVAGGHGVGECGDGGRSPSSMAWGVATCRCRGRRRWATFRSRAIGCWQCCRSTPPRWRTCRPIIKTLSTACWWRKP